MAAIVYERLFMEQLLENLFGDPSQFLARMAILMIAFTVHEFSHAFVADRFGDSTPRANGRVSLNPLVHLDLMGSIMLIFTGFGWARPVPVNPYVLGRHSPAALMFVALAGPASNFLMAVLGAIPIRMNLVSYGFSEPGTMISSGEFFFWFVITNLGLAFFNLIPLAPLDGDKIADYFFPPSWAQVLDTIRPYGTTILMVLMFVLPMMLGVNILNMLISPPIERIAFLLFTQ